MSNLSHVYVLKLPIQWNLESNKMFSLTCTHWDI